MIEIGLQWSKARAYETANAKGAQLIRPVGERRYPVEPFKIEGDEPLHVRFANLDGSEKKCVEFAKAYGLLKSRDQAERLDEWKSEIENLKILASGLQLQVNED